MTSTFVERLVFNVKDDYGALGDGVTDDTAAIQAALDAGSIIYFPAGTFMISASLTIPVGVHLVGAGRWKTIISMTADNTPILHSEEQETYGVVIEQMALVYDTQQTYASHPNSYGIGWSALAASAASAEFWTLRNLRIEKATVGVGIMETGTTRTWYYVWNSHFQELLFRDCSHSMMQMGENSNPVNTFTMISHLDFAGGAVAKSGPAMRLYGEWVINGLDIEDWRNQLIDADGGANCPGSLHGLHVERHTITQASALSCIVLANGKFKVSGIDYQAFVDATNFAHKLIETDTADLIADNITIGDWGAVGTLELFTGAANDSHIIAGVNFSLDTGVTVGGIANTIQLEDAEIKFGTDTGIYRSSANRLSARDNFWIEGTDFRVATGTSDQVYLGQAAISAGPGMQLGSAGDAAIGRAAAKLLALGTDHQLRVGTIAAASAPNDSLFVDSGTSKLSYKDGTGTTNALY